MDEQEAKSPSKVIAKVSQAKVKDPKKVAAGKALAAKNKEKSAKLKAYEAAETTRETIDETDTKPSNKVPWIPIAGLILTCGYLSYQKWTEKPPPIDKPKPEKKNDEKKPPFDF